MSASTAVAFVTQKKEFEEGQGQMAHARDADHGKMNIVKKQKHNHWTSDVDDEDDQSSRNKVRESLKQFKKTLTKLLQEQKGKGGKNHRADIIAANILKKEGKWFSSDDQVGRVPGIKPGDQFQFRAEMAVVGLHKPQVHGISYIRLFDKIYATSIVNSFRYNNVRVSESEFEYIGEGGNPSIFTKKALDQHLTNGNLALKTNMQEKLPVRVIHYWECGNGDDGQSSNLTVHKSDGGKYVYDGLYLVTSYRREMNDCGKMVFKFKMMKMAN